MKLTTTNKKVFNNTQRVSIGRHTPGLIIFFGMFIVLPFALSNNVGSAIDVYRSFFQDFASIIILLFFIYLRTSTHGSTSNDVSKHLFPSTCGDCRSWPLWSPCCPCPCILILDVKLLLREQIDDDKDDKDD